MENRYSYINQGSSISSYRRPYRRNEEFQEEDVWNVIKEDEEVDFMIEESKPPTPRLSISRPLPSAVRMIPGTNKHHDSNEPEFVQQHSAPVSIPDWSKIYGKSPKMQVGSSISSPQTDDDDDDDDGGRGVHSHEWLAKKFERSQVSSFSVCEGAGRTLKGRDLSRVRNAVLSRTGFI
ncbi:hypothetical protein RND81_09G047600 [Saponaria officinalis]|uniref:Senescence regulator n=1 Tax=Saponaria officinalis TaxID=3572 RepID=A0AAW1II34_SAPOF